MVLDSRRQTTVGIYGIGNPYNRFKVLCEVRENAAKFHRTYKAQRFVVLY